MIGLILTLALAIRAVCALSGPSRRLQKGRVTAVSKRFALGPPRFPALSLLDPRQGKYFPCQPEQ